MSGSVDFNYIWMKLKISTQYWSLFLSWSIGLVTFVWSCTWNDMYQFYIVGPISMEVKLYEIGK